ncbi:hypothetical protein KZX45_19020 [Georgenia sp. EYE_87]|uniref:hypothetical protein n=1 Tax=Georgenia sp. EYE_87 TaxID=2853448 RepID=UPI0020040D21|nr:hypothetical protein [Georgenia sp. EYE_87]MCK6212634.1 hypothetical protein [Georgenia sp. EYE_87]
MTRRTISVALIVLGAIAVLAAIASATVWRPTDIATLSLPARPDTPVVVSDAGVLDAVAPDVTIEATAGGDEPVVLAVARTADVDAWVGDAAHTRITGLASWEQLEVTSAEGTAGATEEATEGATEATEEATEATEGATEAPAEPAALPDPAGSDLWVVEQTGTGSAQIEWEDREGRWSLLAATDGTAPAPEVTLTWLVEVDTPWLVPGLLLGGLLLIAGIALLVLDSLAGRERRRRGTPAPVGVRDTEETAVLPATTGATAVLTRRELRERERAAARRGRGRTGEIPVVTTTGEIPVTAAARALDDAGTARGAGIVPASTRSAELRAGRATEERPTGPAGEEPTAAHAPVVGPEEPTAAHAPAVGPEEPTAAHATALGPEEPTTAAAPGPENAVAASGVARGAAVVPASEHAATLRAEREPAEGFENAAAREMHVPEGAGWTEGETADDPTAVLPTVRSDDHVAERASEVSPEAPAAEPGREAPADAPAAEPGADEPPARELHDEDRSGQGWRSMWGFGRGRDRTDEGKEQR